MRHCDVLIVGGGPAGLAAAIALRLRGIEVLVADALSPPIDKACGEGLMPDSQDELARLGVAIPAGYGAPFDGIAFLSERAGASALFVRGTGIGVRRVRLHSLLTERASQLGVRLEWGSRVTFQSGSVHLNGVGCEYRYLIGADGQSSQVRRWRRLDAGIVASRRFGARRHFRVRPQDKRRLVEVYWGDSGQAYITPVADNEICVATVSRSASEGMDGVLRSLPSLRSRLNDATAIGGIRGCLTTTRRLIRVSKGNVLLTGDASGSVDAVVGEGMALSFRQAFLLARAIDAGDLSIYESGHPALMRLPRTMSRALLTMDRSPWLRDRILAMLTRDPKLLYRMLAAHLGEEPLSKFLLRDGALMGRHLLLPPRCNPLGSDRMTRMRKTVSIATWSAVASKISQTPYI